MIEIVQIKRRALHKKGPEANPRALAISFVVVTQPNGLVYDPACSAAVSITARSFASAINRFAVTAHGVDSPLTS